MKKSIGMFLLLCCPGLCLSSTNTHYSPLTQINKSNISKLKKAWVHHTGDVAEKSKFSMPTEFEATPLFVNNKLYVITPFNNVEALDPASGKLLWRFDSQTNLRITSHGAVKSRGLAYWQSANPLANGICQKRIIFGTIEGKIYVLDANTGRPCQDFAREGMLDITQKMDLGEEYVTINDNSVLWTTKRYDYSFISPPAIYKNVIIIGNSSSDNVLANAPDGIVWGIDVLTGQIVWNFNPIPENLRNIIGDVNCWSGITVDQDNGIAFFGTGSPSPDYYGVYRTSPIPSANALVALDANTGKLLWQYQTIHHDLWDYDLPSAPTLVTITKQNKKIPAVVITTKIGFIYVFNRLTGESLFPIKEVSVPTSNVPGEITSPTQPIPEFPEHTTPMKLQSWGMFYFDRKECDNIFSQLDYKGIFTPPSLRGAIHYPSPYGGNNWGGSAFIEKDNLLITNQSNLVMEVKLIPIHDYLQFKKDHPDYEVNPNYNMPYALARRLIVSSFGVPCVPPPWGTISATNLSTGKTVWQKPFGSVKLWGPFHSLTRWGSPTLGGPIVTASGIIFIGASYDHNLHAIAVSDGSLLWESNIGAPGIATPMTYEYHGKQYVVIATGRDAPRGGKLSDALVAFSLSD